MTSIQPYGGSPIREADKVIAGLSLAATGVAAKPNSVHTAAQEAEQKTQIEQKRPDFGEKAAAFVR